MRLIRKIQIGLVLVVGFGLFTLTLPTPIEAYCGGDCSVESIWRCRPKKWGESCGWVYRTACSGSCRQVSCGPGQYECNRQGGCCDVGQVNNCECGTKPNGSCQSCEDEPAPPPAPSPSPPPPSCTVSLSPPSMTISQSQSADLIASVTPQNGSVSSVNFSSGNAAIASVNPASDTTYSYQTSVTGVAGGATSINTSVIMGGASRCSADAAVNIIPIGPWWQVKDGNIHSSSGIFSDIPSGCSGGCIPSLMTGVSGLASYLGTLGVGGGTLSQSGANWQAETVYTGTRTGFGYFKRLLEDDPAGIGVWGGGLPPAGGVFLAESSMATDGAWNIGPAEKFVFLADGDVTITGNIDVAPGGFLAIIASGNIAIAPAVTKIEGVFVSDGVIGTGISNRQLTGEGIFTGWEGINLQRNLDDDSQTPAELFIYRPDLQLNAYRYLLWLGINWREVAP